MHLAKRGISGYTLADKVDKSEAWREIVKFALRHRLHLERMIQTRFEIAAAKDCVPPQSIANTRYLTSYQAANGLACDDIHCALHTEKRVYHDYVVLTAKGYGYQGKELHSFALLNDDLRISPLFRYCLAASEGIEYVMRRYRQAAISQYLMLPSVYDQEWADWITDGLKKIAADFYGEET